MSTENAMVPTGTVQRSGLGYELERVGETSSAAVAARAKALVEARFVMAKRFPRDIDQVRVAINKAISRPGFADMAWYSKPMGQGSAQGFSVRFAEECARAMTNIDVQVIPIHDDAEKRIVEVVVLDLESNNAIATSITFDKTVERKALKAGQVAVKVRTNSKGDTTYIVEATDDEILVKQNSLISKARRTGILCMIPGDIQAEARAGILAARKQKDMADPDAARKRLVDAFAGLNIMPADLREYLGHEVAKASPAQIDDLRSVWSAIDEGETTWQRVIEQVRSERGTAPEDGKTGLAGVTEKLKTQAATSVPPTETKPPAPERDPATGEALPPVDGPKPDPTKTDARKPRRLE